MKKFILFGHSGSYNHGCEALVRSTIQFINSKNVTLYTVKSKEDIEYKLDEICTVKEQSYIPTTTIRKIIYILKSGFYNRIIKRKDKLDIYHNSPFYMAYQKEIYAYQ